MPDFEDKMIAWYQVITAKQSNPYSFENYINGLSNSELVVFISEALKFNCGNG